MTNLTAVTKLAGKMTKVALAVGIASVVGSAMADTDTANLAVGATVVNNCAIGPGTITFASFGLAVNKGLGTLGTQADVDADSGSTISIVCTSGATAAIGAGQGANFSGTRKMADGGNFLPYELYTDTGRGTVLGTTAPTDTIAYTGTGLATTATTIYARIAGADAAAAVKGSYADTVALTVEYTP